MRRTLILISILLFAGCHSEPPPTHFESISIVVPPELAPWMQGAANAFHQSLADGSVLTVAVESTSWLQALRDIPTGIKKPDVWISPHPLITKAANKRVKSLGVSFGECAPLFQSSLLYFGNKKDIASLSGPEAVQEMTLRDGTVMIPDPTSSSAGFLASLTPSSSYLRYPPSLFPLTILHQGSFLLAPEYASAGRVIPTGIDSTQSNIPSLQYGLCIAEGGLRRKPQELGAKLLFQHLRDFQASGPQPAGFQKLNEFHTAEISEEIIENQINNPLQHLIQSKTTILFDVSGSLAEHGFGDAQRIAIGITNHLIDGEDLVLKAVSSLTTKITLKESSKAGVVSFINNLQPKGVGILKDVLKGELETIKSSPHSSFQHLIVITDGENIDTTTSLLSMLEPISRSKQSDVTFFFTNYSPLLEAVRDFKLPGVLVVAPNEIPLWMEYLNSPTAEH